MLIALVRSAEAQAPVPAEIDPFDDTFIHTIQLTINPRDWDELKANFQLNLYYPAHVTWNGVTVQNVGIRSRGAASRSATKPGVRIDFNRYDLTKRFLGLKSVVLRNNTQDPSNLHERLAMKVFAWMGVPASRQAHARLHVNGAYAGLYTVVEAVDKNFLQRHFGQDNGYLYGYDYPLDGSSYFFDYKGPDPALYAPLFHPETHELDPNPGPLVDFIRIVNETPEAQFLGVVSQYLDLAQFMRYVAVENFLGETDGIVGTYVGMNNFYLYQFEGTTLFRFIPWDKSEAFTGGPEYPIWHYVHDVPTWMRNRLMDRAVRFSELRAVYLDTLLECIRLTAPPNPSDEALPVQSWLEAEITSEYQQIHAAALADPFKPFTNEQFETAIQHLLAFARARADFVRQDVARSPR
ncbi:MAG TPA: CotH kinase family protein [Vicinamibacterales bacterium]